MNEQTSRRLYAARAVAILCSVSAHMPGTGIVGRVLELLGTMGVPFFLFSSGLMVSRTGRLPWAAFLKKAGPPWLVGGTLMWCVGRFMGYHSLTWIRFLLGDGSYLYYLTVAFFLSLLFSFLPDSLTVWAFAAGVFRVLSFHLGMGPANPYLSVTYWLFYFSLGKFIRSCLHGDLDCLLQKVMAYSRHILPLWLVCAAVYLSLPQINYFTVMAIPFSIISIAAIFCLGIGLEKAGELFIQIGKQTLAVYIWHIYIAGFIQGRLLRFGILQGIGPVLALLVTYGLLWAGGKLAERVRLQRPYGILTGFKVK